MMMSNIKKALGLRSPENAEHATAPAEAARPQGETPMALEITMRVDGVERRLQVEPRLLLIEALREKLGVTGPHVGCEAGRCGACAVMLDGQAVKSCMMLAAQADGAEITTAAGLERDRAGRALQRAFHERHALQCGYCTPGMLSAAADLLKNDPAPDEAAIRHALRGNLCRCTGYHNIIEAVRDAAAALSAEDIGNAGGRS